MTDKEYNERIQVFDGKGDEPDTLLVYNHDTYMTVKGLADDKVYSFWDPEPAVYVYNGGNVTLDGFPSESTIVLGDAKFVSSMDPEVLGEGFVFKLSNNKTITFTNRQGYLDKLSIASSLDDVLDINVLPRIYSDNAVIKGTDGKDWLINWDGKYASVDGGAGDDYLDMGWGEAKGYYCTVSGGAGNDYIGLTPPGMTYIYSSGNDTLEKFGLEDTLVIGDLSITSSIRGIDGDITLNMSNDGSIYILGMTTGFGYWSDKINTVASVEDAKRINIVNSLTSVVSNTNPKISVASGTDGNDVFDGVGEANWSILCGDGDDIFYDLTSGISIDGGKGNDYIQICYAMALHNVLIDGGEGDDLIIVDGYDNTISGGEGNDSISFKAPEASIYIYGGGNDTLGSFPEEGTIVLGDVKVNSSVRSGSTVRLNLSNNNTLTLTDPLSNEFKIVASLEEAQEGKVNSLRIFGNDYPKNSTVMGTDGKDWFTNWNANDVLISVGAGDDYVENRARRVNVLTGAGNDTIYNWQRATIDSGADNDFIENYYSNNQIICGAGDDTVRNGAESTNTSITGDAGNDEIHNVADDVVINAGDGDDTIDNSDENFQINAGGSNVSIDAGKGNDSIYGNNNYATINGGSGSDTITGNHWQSHISGDAGDDLIDITTYAYNTLDGGAGNDTIIAGGDGHSVNGGIGNDLINLSGTGLIISGGKGNDTISGSDTASRLYQYKKGDGSDIIYGYNENDSIMISGAKFSTTTSGEDVIVKVGNFVAMTLIDAKDKQLNIYSAGSNTDDMEEVSPQQEIIKRFMYYLDNTNDSGKIALDGAINYASDGYFPDVNSLMKQMIADSRNLSLNDFLVEKCGIDLSNKDTGAITGSDAGGTTTKTAKDIVPETGELDTSFNETSFTTENGLTFHLAENTSSQDELYIWQALKTWWADEGLKLIKESYDYSFLDSDAVVKDIVVVFEEDYTANGNYLAYTDYLSDSGSLVLAINKAYYNSFVNTDSNGESPEGEVYLDRTVAHELTHAVMMAKISNYWDLPQFITEGTAELTHGIDDVRGNVIETLSNNYESLQESLSLIPGTGGSFEYAGGYMFLRYLAQQSAEHYSPSSTASKAAIKSNVNDDRVTVKGSILTVSDDYIGEKLNLTDYSSKVKNVNAKSLTKSMMTVGNKNMMITGNKSANSIVTGEGNDTIFANAGKDTLDGGKGNDILYGEAGNDSLSGGKGNDSLNGGTGNDTLTGGDGNDIFIFGRLSGKDTITDYTAGKDKVKLIEGGITGASVSGSDLILEGQRTGLITIKDGKNKKITVIDGNGTTTTKKYSDAVKVLTVTDKTKSPVTISSSIQVIDASARTTKVKITGNKLANTIIGGSGNDSLFGGSGKDSLNGGDGKDSLFGDKDADILQGGKGNDTLWGGAGNDSLYGGSGNDVFIYKPGEGTDKIFDYSSGDMLKILKSNGSAGGSFSKSSFSGGVLTLTINGGGKVILGNVTANDQFNINGKTYQISGSKLK